MCYHSNELRNYVTAIRACPPLGVPIDILRFYVGVPERAGEPGGVRGLQRVAADLRPLQVAQSDHIR